VGVTYDKDNPCKDTFRFLRFGVDEMKLFLEQSDAIMKEAEFVANWQAKVGLEGSNIFTFYCQNYVNV